MQPLSTDPVVATVLADRWQRASGYHTLRPQGASSWLLIFTVSGRGRFEHAQGEVWAESGDAILMSPRRRHGYGADGDWDFYWAHFQPRAHWMSWLQWPSLGPGMRRMPCLDSTERLFSRVVTELWAPDSPLADERAMHAFEGLLLDWAVMLPTKDEADPRIARVARLLREQPGHLSGVEEMAGLAGLSMSRFAHLFREQIGQAPRAYAEMQKIALASTLLRTTDWPHARIAAAAGFGDEFYFSSRFRHHTGQPPGVYRRTGSADSQSQK